MIIEYFQKQDDFSVIANRIESEISEMTNKNVDYKETEKKENIDTLVTDEICLQQNKKMCNGQQQNINLSKSKSETNQSYISKIKSRRSECNQDLVFLIQKKKSQYFKSKKNNAEILTKDLFQNFQKEQQIKRIISDKADDIDLLTKLPRNYFFNFMEEKLTCLNCPVFQPQNRLIIVWELIKSITIIILLFVLNLHVVFGHPGHLIKNIEYQLILFSFLIFFVEILIKCNTSILIQGNLIRDRTILIQKYLSKNAIFDILVFFPLIYLLAKGENNHQQNSNNQERIIVSFAFFKLNDLFSTFSNIDQYFSCEKDSKNIMDLIKLSLQTLFVAHVFSTLWYLICYLEQHYFGIDKTWIDLSLYHKQDSLEIYVTSFYYAAVTMTTVGYGDITPQNKYERSLIMISIFFTTMYFAFVLNSVGQIMQNIRSKNNKYKEQLSIINRQSVIKKLISKTIFQFTFNMILITYRIHHSFTSDFPAIKQKFLFFYKIYLLSISIRVLDSIYFRGKQYLIKKNVNSNISIRIRDYFDNIYKNQEDFQKGQEKKMINLLPRILRNELCEAVEGKFLFQQKLFIQNFSREFLKKLMVYIEEVHYYPDEYLYQEQIEDDQSVYFLLQGKVRILRKSTIIQVIEVNSQKNYIGEQSFFTGQMREYSVNAVDYCCLYKISRKNLLNDVEQYHQIKDRLLVLNDHGYINSFCLICENQNHTEVTCKCVYFNINKQSFQQTLKYEFYQQSKRIKINRGQYSKIKSLLILKMVEEKQKDYIEKNGQINIITPNKINSVQHSNSSEEQSSQSEEEYELEELEQNEMILQKMIKLGGKKSIQDNDLQVNFQLVQRKENINFINQEQRCILRQKETYAQFSKWIKVNNNQYFQIYVYFNQPSQFRLLTEEFKDQFSEGISKKIIENSAESSIKESSQYGSMQINNQIYEEITPISSNTININKKAKRKSNLNQSQSAHNIDCNLSEVFKTFIKKIETEKIIKEYVNESIHSISSSCNIEKTPKIEKENEDKKGQNLLINDTTPNTNKKTQNFQSIEKLSSGNQLNPTQIDENQKRNSSIKWNNQYSSKLNNEQIQSKLNLYQTSYFPNSYAEMNQFDLKKRFQVYFIHNNYDNILKEFKKQQKIKIKSKRFIKTKEFPSKQY